MNSFEWKIGKVNGLKIKYFETEGKSGVPLVMIPGWPVSTCIFEPLATVLGDSLHCVAINLPGFGGSDFDLENNHTFDYYCQFLEDFRKEILKTKKINLFGYSTGGVVAIDYASKFPQNL